jgi:hypothetical protein
MQGPNERMRHCGALGRAHSFAHAFTLASVFMHAVGLAMRRQEVLALVRFHCLRIRASFRSQCTLGKQKGPARITCEASASLVATSERYALAVSACAVPQVFPCRATCGAYGVGCSCAFVA